MANENMNLMASILDDLQGNLSAEQLEMLKNYLSVKLNNYDIKRKLFNTENRSNSELIEAYLSAKHLEGLAESSGVLYSICLNEFSQWWNKPLVNASTDDIRDFFSYNKNEKKITSTTLSSKRRVLHGFYAWLYEEGIIQRNPVKRIAAIKKDTIPEAPFSQRDIELLRLGINNDRDRAIMEFLLSTGCRISEMINANISDIDTKELSLDVVGKGNKKRTVYLRDSSWVYVEKYLNSRDDDNPALFVTKRKPIKRLSEDTVERMMNGWSKNLGVENCHPHRFRTTLCCNLLNQGIDVVTVRDILGHSSLDTTMIYYRYNKTKAKLAYKNN